MHVHAHKCNAWTPMFSLSLLRASAPHACWVLHLWLLLNKFPPQDPLQHTHTNCMWYNKHVDTHTVVERQQVSYCDDNDSSFTTAPNTHTNTQMMHRLILYAIVHVIDVKSIACVQRIRAFAAELVVCSSGMFNIIFVCLLKGLAGKWCSLHCAPSISLLFTV